MRILEIDHEEIKVKKTFINTDSLKQDLSTLCNAQVIKSTLSTILEKKYGTQALQAVINKLDLLLEDGSAGNYNLKLGNLNQFMKLDLAAIGALNIFPPKYLSSANTNSNLNSNNSSSKDANVFGVLVGITCNT